MSPSSEHVIATRDDGDDDDDDNKNNVICGDRFTDSDLDPSVWSDLPTAMVELIFARLPLREVYRLRSLSRGWRSAIASHDSEFMRLVMTRRFSNKLIYNSEVDDTGHSKIIVKPLVAIWSGIADANHSNFTFQVLDHNHDHHDDLISASKINFESWCAPLTFTPPVEYLFSWLAHDGGLVCLFADIHIRSCTFEDDDDEEEELLRNPTPVPLLVANPLTNVQKTLPLQNVVHRYPDMVQLRVDRNSGEYKVILVGQGELIVNGSSATSGYVAEIYNSSTGAWSTLSSGYVFDFRFDYVFFSETRSVRIYDCGQGKFQKPHYSSPPNGVLVACTQFKGSYYVLQRETKRTLQEADQTVTLESTHSREDEVTYTISQFQCDDESYRLSLKGKIEVVDKDKSSLDRCKHPILLACNGFILLVANNSRYNDDDQEWELEVLMRLYNMALGYWVTIPQGRLKVATSDETHTQDHMIELQWAVVP